MLITLHVADKYIRFFDEEELSDIGVDSPQGRLIVTDTVTGASQGFNCTAEQMAAIAYMAIHPEGEGSEDDYDLIGTMFDGVPNNLRPIP